MEHIVGHTVRSHKHMPDFTTSGFYESSIQSGHYYHHPNLLIYENIWLYKKRTAAPTTPFSSVTSKRLMELSRGEF